MDVLAEGDATLDLDRTRTTMADIAADKLREFILLEKLLPGAGISERDVAAALGISRTPIKTALAVLEQEGLVEYSVTRRPRVADPSVEKIVESLTVMGALEALAGELACANASGTEIDEIRALVRRMREGSDHLPPLDFFRADMDMHQMIVRASGNAALMETHRQYNARLWRARFLSSRRKAGRAKTLAEHEVIAEALADRNTAATALALRTHLSTAVANTRSVRADGSGEEDGS